MRRTQEEHPTPWSSSALPADFERLYAESWSRIVALAWSLTGSPAVAEELAQEAFLDAFRRWDHVGALDEPGAWVRRAVANRSISAYRKRQSEADSLRRLRAERPAEQDPALDEDFWATVRALPDRQAVCVALHYLEDRSVREIAVILDCAPSTVKVHLHRGRRTLAERLQPADAFTGGELR